MLASVAVEGVTATTATPHHRSLYIAGFHLDLKTPRTFFGDIIPCCVALLPKRNRMNCGRRCGSTGD